MSAGLIALGWAASEREDKVAIVTGASRGIGAAIVACARPDRRRD
jgi:hypothetical protein